MKKDSEWTFIGLKRAAAECDGSLPCCKTAILGDSATQHLAVAVRGYLFRKGVPTAVYEAEYDSVMQETIDAGSGLYRFCPDFILLYLCTEKLYQKFCKTPEERRARFAEEAFGEIAGYWNAIFAHTRAKIVQYNFIERDDGVFGSYALKTETSFLSQLKKLNRLLEEGCRAQKDVYVCDLNGLAAYYGYRNFHSEALYDVATMPIYTEFVPQAAKRAGDIILALRGKGKKCVVLDLDNTLWGGVVGDDGLEGIQACAARTRKRPPNSPSRNTPTWCCACPTSPYSSRIGRTRRRTSAISCGSSTSGRTPSCFSTTTRSSGISCARPSPT